jgi:hypothetical protein
MEFFVFLFMIVMFLMRGWDIHLRVITPEDLLCSITIVFFQLIPVLQLNLVFYDVRGP